ncbi:MAG: lipoyl(octanoyl) transferase LipB [Pseudomonadales bacterium]|jgi:lipoyl(octanoyl) transferase|nr:lipoyl(octanoyl) transferase LipB [Pseudomonadales bacterium]
MNQIACEVRWLGRRAYQEVWDAMRRFTAERNDDTPDELWLLEHDPVFTQGQTGKAEHILDPHGIPIVQTDRGGQVTYHGPGQLVVYFLLDVRRKGYGVRALVDLIERSILRLLREFGIEGELRPQAPGVYVQNAKIAALGLRIRRGCSLHGLSLNIDMDLTPFTWINPCGYAGLRATSLRELLPEADTTLFTLARERLLAILLQELAAGPPRPAL